MVTETSTLWPPLHITLWAGQWSSDPSEILQAFADHFSQFWSLLPSDAEITCAQSKILEGISGQISAEQNSMMTREQDGFTAEFLTHH